MLRNRDRHDLAKGASPRVAAPPAADREEAPLGHQSSAIKSLSFMSLPISQTS